MDVVYVVKADAENDSEELRYSLRSLRNVPHAKVYIVGEKPEWVTNVHFISVMQSGSKAQNVSRNLQTAVNNPQISDDFILMNDDFFIMKAVHEIPTLTFGAMSDVIRDYNRRYPEGSDYIDRLQKGHERLQRIGIANPISYELHVPIVINKCNAVNLFEEASKERLYQFRSSYGNLYRIGGEPSNDVKVFLDARHNAPLYNRDAKIYLQSQEFLSATGGAFKRGAVGDFIRRAFPDKSDYEAY